MNAPAKLVPTKIDADMQRQWSKMARELSTLKKKYNIAHEERIVAIAKAAELKHRAKTAEGNLKRLEVEARRYLFLKSIGSEAALAMLKPWETDGWDLVIDKNRPK